MIVMGTFVNQETEMQVLSTIDQRAITIMLDGKLIRIPIKEVRKLQSYLNLFLVEARRLEFEEI